jgi:ornithine cyclodeaminase/alanine dehydrogenase-like protein (mu-crystallin family)
VLPLRRAFAWDRDADRAQGLADAVRADGLAIEVARDLDDAAQASDVIVTCTTSTAPFLRRGAIRPGTFIAAVGADSSGKSEVDPDLMAEALVVTDSTEQCAAMGDLHHAVAAGVLSVQDVHGELGEVVSGRLTIPERSDRIIVFDSTGMAIQDAAAAAFVYRRALRSGRGTMAALGST